jgi:hypothetical protein
MIAPPKPWVRFPNSERAVQDYSRHSSGRGSVDHTFGGIGLRPWTDRLSFRFSVPAPTELPTEFQQGTDLEENEAYEVGFAIKASRYEGKLYARHDRSRGVFKCEFVVENE